MFMQLTCNRRIFFSYRLFLFRVDKYEIMHFIQRAILYPLWHVTDHTIGKILIVTIKFQAVFKHNWTRLGHTKIPLKV